VIENRRILVVDDEPQITRVLRRSLMAHQYHVRVAAEGESALDLFTDWRPDLVVTDLSMPNMGGLELCRRLRAISDVPIIVLSVKGDERAKVEALDSGADDFVTKPFGMNELLARVRAALRRAPAATDKEAPSPVLAAGDFRVDVDARNVNVHGRDVHLTPKEFDLLVYFIRNTGRVLTHRKLLTAIWGGNYADQNEYLRVFVGQLRKKIEPNPSKPQYILTEPWVGYRFQSGD
jgi:two-component system, OmpR family, KDP operon response regulator KdpE